MLRDQLDTQKQTHKVDVTELKRENERLVTLNKILETEKNLQHVELNNANQQLQIVNKQLAHAQKELRELRMSSNVETCAEEERAEVIALEDAFCGGWN